MINSSFMGSKNKWISVEDRLPINQKDMISTGYQTNYVFAFNGEEVFPAEFRCGSVGNYWYKFERKDGVEVSEQVVTHWMPMPESPK